MNVPNSTNFPESLKSNLINKELLYFKEEILRDLKSMESKLNSKINTQIEETDKKLLNFETKTDNLTQRVFTLSNKFTDSENMKLNINSLLTYRTKMDEILFSHEFKTSVISKDLKDAINKYDKIINDNIVYPGIIGTNGSRFQNMHYFIDYVLTNIKDKSFQMDLKAYKVKIDGIVENLKNKIEEIVINNNNFTEREVEKIDKKFTNILNIYEDKITNIRIENAKSYQNLDKYAKILTDELEQIHEMKNELIDLFNGNMTDFKKTLNINEIKYNEFQKQFFRLQSQFNDLKEWLRDSRVISKEMPKSLKNESNSSYKSKMNNAESYLKKYIEGEVSMNDLIHRKASDKEKNENENLDEIYRISGCLKSNEFKSSLKSHLKYDNSNNINNINNIHDLSTNSRNKTTPLKTFKKSYTQKNIHFSFGNKQNKNEIINNNSEFKLENEGINSNILRKSTFIKSGKKNSCVLENFSHNKFISEDKNDIYDKISNFLDIAENDIIKINNDQKNIIDKKIEKIKKKDNEKEPNSNLLSKSSNYVIQEMENEYDNNKINSICNKNIGIKSNKEVNNDKNNDNNSLSVEKDKKLENTDNPINNKSINNTKINDSFANFLKIENGTIKLNQNIKENNNNILNNPSVTFQKNNININNNINSKNNNNYIKKVINDINQRETKKDQNLINQKDKVILHKILKGEREGYLTFDLIKKVDKIDYSRNIEKTPIKSNTYSNRFFTKDSNMVQGKLHVINFPIEKKIKEKESKKNENEGLQIINIMRRITKDNDIKKKRGNHMRSADKIYCVNMP